MPLHPLKQRFTVYRFRRTLLPYVLSALVSSIATLAIAGVNSVVSIPNISLLYLPTILFAAVYFGTGPSLCAAIVAVIEYDFFLLAPLFTFTINQAQDILALIIFLIVAVLTGQLAAGTRSRAEAARQQATQSSMLYELGQALMSAHDVSDILHAMTRQIVNVFEVERCAIFVPGDRASLTLAAETFRGRPRDRASVATATWVFQHGTEVGLPDGEAHHLYIPLRAADQMVGVLEVGPKRSGFGLDNTEQGLITSFAAQASLLIARAQVDRERQRANVLEESDRLKSSLLSAVSHDLRTPLASIKTSITSLLLIDAAWTGQEGREMLTAIDTEADRLNRLVGNLLDLSRIEAGVLYPVLEWYDVQEMLDLVVPHLRSLLTDRPFNVSLAPGILAIHVDLLRIDELVYNLVENAVKYTPARCPIELHIEREDAAVRIDIVDHGPGIPQANRHRIFDRFVQGQAPSDRSRGIGLGLAICRGIAEAHGGVLRVDDTPGGGATFSLSLPRELMATEAMV